MSLARVLLRHFLHKRWLVHPPLTNDKALQNAESRMRERLCPPKGRARSGVDGEHDEGLAPGRAPKLPRNGRETCGGGCKNKQPRSSDGRRWEGA
jgi:hypothetical protein